MNLTADPEISICIVSFNTRDILRDCLRSIAANVRLPHEIIIVDNHSTDGTVDMLGAEYPEIQLIQNTENKGYTVPMNQALRAARSRQFLVQLNPDTVVLPDSFDCMVDFLRDHPQVGICTPKVLNRDGTLQKQCRRSAARPWDVLAYFLGLGRLFPKNRKFNGYLMGYFDENETHPVEAVSGSCMFIRRAVIEKIGYLDEQLFAYQEDSEFCFRAREAGWQIFYFPASKIIHYGGQGGSLVDQSNAIREWHRSYYIYYRKHLARDYFFLFNWFFYGLMFAKMALALASARLTHRGYVGSPKP